MKIYHETPLNSIHTNKPLEIFVQVRSNKKEMLSAYAIYSCDLNLSLRKPTDRYFNSWELIYIAILKAIELAYDAGLMELIIFISNQPLAESLKNRKYTKNKMVYTYRNMIWSEQKKFYFLEVKYLPKRKNKKAQQLCIKALREKRNTQVGAQ